MRATKVEGSGEISVDVNARKNTKVAERHSSNCEPQPQSEDASLHSTNEEEIWRAISGAVIAAGVIFTALLVLA